MAFVNNVATRFEIPIGVEEIGDTAIFSKMKLKEIIIPNTVTSIKLNAFEEYRGLTKITIPNSVKMIGNLAFTKCDNLREISIDNKVGNINGNPWGCVYGGRAIKWLK